MIFTTFLTKTFLATSITALALACSVVSSSSTPADLTSLLPAPTPDKNMTAKGLQKAVFAGGCFWGVEAVFENVKGVTEVVSGYSGGEKGSADYETVSGGETGHAEAVEVTFDPSKVTYQQLLLVFFGVAHNPTELNKQGPDHGPQYRSAIFFANDEQRDQAKAFIEAVEKAKAFDQPIVTQVTPLVAFYEAEGYHQNYLVKHPNDSYIVAYDAPKLVELKQKFPALYAGK